MSVTLIEAHGVDAGYDGRAVVRGLDLQVKAGEIVALFGPNGAGKTTTLLTLAGAIPLIGGEVTLFGEPTRAPLFKRVRQGMAFITDRRSLILKLSARDNLRLRGGSIDDALRLFPELGEFLDRPAGLLSGGQQQMLAVARSLASRPRLLLADELSLGLAPLIVQRLLAALRLAADDGLGVLLVEQHVRQALTIADRGYVLGEGHVKIEGDANALGQQIADVEATYLRGSNVEGSMTGPRKAKETD